MNRDVQDDLQRRITALERSAARHRVGEVTATTPLEVALGGASVSYADVKSVATGLQVGDIVSVLTFGNDLIVLGVIGDGS